MVQELITEYGGNNSDFAEFDETMIYRYSLKRIWHIWKPVLNFIMLNPSTADANINDPTVRRCIGFAKELGYGTLYVTNLFALRATSPKALKACADPVGLRNNEKLIQYASMSDTVICAWGKHGSLFNRGKEVVEEISKTKTLNCLKMLACGNPGHPLYLKKDLKPTVFKESVLFDADLFVMNEPQLRAVALAMRQAIRKHRDNQGHNLCWYQPELWNLLPDKPEVKPHVPKTDAFLENCRIYRESLDK